MKFQILVISSTSVEDIRKVSVLKFKILNFKSELHFVFQSQLFQIVISTMAKAASTPKAAKATKEPKEKRAPTPYNTFMKTEIAKVKKANASLDHKEAFKVAAGNWKNSKENPANKK